MIRALWTMLRWLRATPRPTPTGPRWHLVDQDDPELRAAVRRYEERERRGAVR